MKLRETCTELPYNLASRSSETLRMPFFQINGRLVYYAHVPKCGGSSVASYIRNRFGAIAFHDNAYLKQSAQDRWTRSSPQHVDSATLERLIPLSFFSAIFTIVRHPVARAVSTFHFQSELEKSIPEGMGFSEWLLQLEARKAEDPFCFDNHTRPMSEIVPEGATVFHMEHGLDGLIGWFDGLAGDNLGPRAILPENTRGAHVRVSRARVRPTPEDVALIGRLYVEDFRRFGYHPDNAEPQESPPSLDASFLAARDRALAAANRPAAVFRRRLARKFGWS